MPHRLCTAAPPGTACLQVRPHLPHGMPQVQLTYSPTSTIWMNKIDQGNVGLIEWMNLGSLGSMGPLVRPVNRHNYHSKAILGVLERRRFIQRHRGGPAALRGSVAPSNRSADRNRHKIPTFNLLTSKDQEHPSREAVDHRAGRTCSSGRTYENGPTHPTDLTCLSKGTSHSLEQTHSAGASHFHSFVHLE
jgi:hypothetical protein